MNDTVLVIDDDWRVCDILEEVLGDMGIGVKQALKPEDANRMLKEKNFALIMVDVTLGSENGTTLAKTLMEKGENVVLFTAKDDLWLSHNVPLDMPVLKKPFRIEDLTSLLNRFGLEEVAAI